MVLLFNILGLIATGLNIDGIYRQYSEIKKTGDTKPISYEWLKRSGISSILWLLNGLYFRNIPLILGGVSMITFYALIIRLKYQNENKRNNKSI